MRERVSIRSIQRRYWLRYPWEYVGPIWRRLLCRVLGHKEPYHQKMSGELCGRCYKMMNRRAGQLKLTVHRGGKS